MCTLSIQSRRASCGPAQGGSWKLFARPCLCCRADGTWPGPRKSVPRTPVLVDSVWFQVRSIRVRFVASPVLPRGLGTKGACQVSVPEMCSTSIPLLIPVQSGTKKGISILCCPSSRRMTVSKTSPCLSWTASLGMSTTMAVFIPENQFMCSKLVRSAALFPTWLIIGIDADSFVLWII